MAKRSRKKKAERSDFAKVRLKVGRRLPKCLNETRVSLATGKIVVREQLPTVSAADAPDSQPPEGASSTDAASVATGAPPPRQHLRKLRSNQMSERVAAASRIARWLSSPDATPEAVRQLFAFNELAEYLAPCLREPGSPELRAAARRVFAGLLDRGGLGEVPAYWPALFQAMRACWSHLDETVQLESVEILADLLDKAPAAVLDSAGRIRRLFCRLRRRLSSAAPAAAAAAAGSTTSSSGSSAGRATVAPLRSRRQLMTLADCVGRFASAVATSVGHVADDIAIGAEAETMDTVAVGECLDDFDLNTAAWTAAGLAGAASSDTGRHRQQLLDLDVEEHDGDDSSGDEADNCGGGGDVEGVGEFETSLAGLVKELLPSEFAGRVAGAAAFAEFLTLLQCLRGVLMMHCWTGRRDGCRCGEGRDRQQKGNSTAAASTCSLAVGDLLANTLCPVFPLTVLSSTPSCGGAISKKHRRPGKAKDSLKDVAARAKELNSLIVECALICGSRLEASAGREAFQTFVLAVYRFLAGQFGGRVTSADADFWLNASRRLILRHPQNRLSSLFLAFFSDSLRHGRFERPLPVTRFLVRVACAACRGQGQGQGQVQSLLSYLPVSLVEAFDSAKLHYVSAEAADPESLQLAACAVRCLLELTSRGFPGAAQAVEGASDRLVRCCPDRLLRRSLSAVLAVLH